MEDKRSTQKHLFMPLQEQDLDMTNIDHLMRVQSNWHQLSEEQKLDLLDQEANYKAMSQMPKDPRHPFYYHVYSNTLPPEQAYRLQPKRRYAVTNNQEETKIKGYKRRYYYDGWNNLTEFEKDWIQKVKQELRQNHGIDLDQVKDFGPRAPDGTVIEGQQHIVNGRDLLLKESDILRYCITRQFDMSRIIPDLKYYLQWRQTNVPLPLLTDQTLNIMNKGLLYIHGRCKDYTPILVMDFVLLGEMIDNNEITAASFCSLHNFVARYIINNMFIPGQIEKWQTICNINQFSLNKLPVSLFKLCARELQNSYVDCCAKTNIVNLSWFQNMVFGMLQACLDEDIRSRQVFSSELNPEDLKKLIHPSQLEVTYGGTAPKVTQFWPPTMPVLTEKIDDNDIDVPINPASVVKRTDYDKFYQENQGLALMPRHMRVDLPPLPQDFEKGSGSIPAVNPPISALKDREFPDVSHLENEKAHAFEQLVNFPLKQNRLNLKKLNCTQHLRLTKEQIDKIKVSQLQNDTKTTNLYKKGMSTNIDDDYEFNLLAAQASQRYKNNSDLQKKALCNSFMC